jgi:hypothetical protein
MQLPEIETDEVTFSFNTFSKYSDYMMQYYGRCAFSYVPFFVALEFKLSYQLKNCRRFSSILAFNRAVLKYAHLICSGVHVTG